MSGLEINKIVGTVLLVTLITLVIGMAGNTLVPEADRKPTILAGNGAPPPPTAAAPAAMAKLAPIAPLLAAAKVSDGKAVARKCTTCHSLKQGGKNKVGPNLWDIVNAPKARTIFSYSNSLKASGGTWTFEDLNGFLLRPKAFIKGTKMSFAGIKKASDRAALMVYLRSLSNSPVPLP